MNIVCIGSGYVGTVMGAAFTSIGHKTTIVDTDPQKVKRLLARKPPIYEPGLEALLQAAKPELFHASTTYEAVTEADVVFIGVGTPSRSDGSADLRYIRMAAESIAKHLRQDRFTVIVDKSTVPVGTAALVSHIIEQASGLQAETGFTVASNPEFLREGYALEDVFFPDRIVVGTNHKTAALILRQLYHPIRERIRYATFLQGTSYLARKLESPKPVYMETDPYSAEMIKYASNAFLALKISYMNEIARLCEALGAHAPDVARGMGLDTRIGEKFLQVSSGWSGSCLPKDTAELLATSLQYGSELTMVKAAIESNKAMHAFCVDKLKQRLKSLNGKRIGILGLTFKPDTDDARETQASFIIRQLTELGAIVTAYDPEGMVMFRTLNPDLPVHYGSSGAQTADKSDAIMLLTQWQAFHALDWVGMYQAMRTPYILDTRNALNRSDLVKIGYEYEGIGLLPERK